MEPVDEADVDGTNCWIRWYGAPLTLVKLPPAYTFPLAPITNAETVAGLPELVSRAGNHVGEGASAPGVVCQMTSSPSSGPLEGPVGAFAVAGAVPFPPLPLMENSPSPLTVSEPTVVKLPPR